MKVSVENGLAGCELAVQRDAIAVIVDALRASATITSLFEFGTERLVVVEEVSAALQEKQRRPQATLFGERGGTPPEGFDHGNSPLQNPPENMFNPVVFSSSNCSRCCVGVLQAPAAFPASTVNATAAAKVVSRAAKENDTDEIVLITAGSVANEVQLTIEDHIAAGAILAEFERREPNLEIGNDRARVCRQLYGDGDEAAVRNAFRRSDNGKWLAEVRLGDDVEFSARLDVFDAVPRIGGSVELADGGQGALVLA